jgi:CBS domain containing-hemolysin-like protein
MRTTVRTLIMRQRFTSAVQSFDERYNFLRFSDAKIIAPADQNIVRLQKDQTVFAALAAMRAENVPCAPVYADEALKEEPVGFLYMNDVIRLLLDTMQQMFKPAKDPVAIQLRLDRISGDASTFSQTPISSLVRKDWKPIRPGYMVYNLGGVLAQGVRQVPYCNDEGDLVYLISQESFLAAFNEDPRVRLGGLAHVTAMDLKCIKPVTKVPATMPLAEAFKAADADRVSGHAAVVVDETTGKVLWSVGPETLNAHGLDTPDALGIALSKPVQDLHRDLLEQGSEKEVDVQAVVTCKPSTSLQSMVRRVVESGRSRVWVVDDSERPIGVVLLTEMIACIMSSEDRKK